MVWQTNVYYVDGRRRSVISCEDNVEQPSEVMGWRGNAVEQPMVGEYVDELYSCWVVRSIKANIQVGDDVDGFRERRKAIK